MQFKRHYIHVSASSFVGSTSERWFDTAVLCNSYEQKLERMLVLKMENDCNFYAYNYLRFGSKTYSCSM